MPASDTSVYITPLMQSTPTATPSGDYTINILSPAPGGGLDFNLTDGGGSGTFSASTVTIPAGQYSVTFTYQNAAAATYTLTATGVTGLWAGVISSAQCIVTGSGAPTAFSVSPMFASVAQGVEAVLTILLLRAGVPVIAGGGGQTFSFIDSSVNGAFNPPASVTVPAGQSMATFSYSNINIGSPIITVSAVGNPYSVNTQAAQITITGGFAMAAFFNPSDVVWGLGYLYSSDSPLSPDNIPFATLQDFQFKDSYGTKKLMGPESLTAVAAGYTERTLTGEATYGRVRAKQFLKARGATLTKQVAVTSPSSFGPTPTPSVTGGAITVITSNLVIGVAYSYANPYGQTLISPITAITFAAATVAGSVALTAVTLPTGATAVNWFTTTTGYPNSGAAQAATLYFLVQNTGAAWTMTALAASTSAVIPTANNLTLRTLVSSFGNDEAPVFNLHLKTPSDGSQFEMFVYSVICPELTTDVKLRDFVLPKLTFEMFGDNTVTPTKMWDILLPGDQTV